MKKSLFLSLFLLIFTPLFAVYAFDPNDIISDNDINDYESMSLGAIQEFLRKKDGTLYNYITIDRDGNLRMAVDIIYLAAVTNKVNPKFLLVLLQKEQSLVEDSTPVQGQFDWATGYAVCDSCDVSEPSIERFKGFPKQVNSAAAQVRYYMDNPNEFYYKKNKQYVIDKEIVVPANTATAALYNYTPHIAGNKNFDRIWNRWFGRKFPDGAILQDKEDENSSVYLIKDGKKREFSSWASFTSRYSPKKIQKVSKEDIEQIEDGESIKFPPFSLLQSVKGTIYLLTSNDEIRGISSMGVFKKLGFNPDEIVSVTDEDLASYIEISSITMDSIYPTGALLQNQETGGVYYVEDGVKHPIWSKQLLEVNFKNKKITAILPTDLDKFNNGTPVLFKDGELVTSPATKTVYVISGGKKLPISSADVFNSLGYSWDNIIMTSDKVLSLHETGEPVTSSW